MKSGQEHSLAAIGILMLLILAGSALSATAQAGLVGKWTFQADQFTGATVKDQTGDLDGTVVGPIVLSSEPEALLLDGERTYVRMSSGIDTARLPPQSLTAEAWVALGAGTRWGGIVGCIQDNGSFEKGWLLGYDNTMSVNER